MSEPQSPSRESASRIGRHIKGGFLNYINHWQEWMPPVLVAALVVIVSFVCCFLPYLLVVGPIVCGLYGCAISAIRNGPVDVAHLNRGWRSPVSSTIAWLFIKLGAMLPMILLLGCFFIGFSLLAASIPPESARHRAADTRWNRPAVDLAGQAVETAGEEDADPAAEAAEAPGPDAGQPPDRPQRQVSDRAGRQRPEEPPPEVVAAMLFGILAFYAVMFLVGIVSWVWSMWFTTRTMFVLPLIADRRLGFAQALRQSWTETRQGFWELLVINFVAGLIGMIGIYAMYVGLLFTVPIYFTIIASVYEERFPQGEEPALDGSR